MGETASFGDGVEDSGPKEEAPKKPKAISNYMKAIASSAFKDKTSGNE